jgi:hypothetical protein
VTRASGNGSAKKCTSVRKPASGGSQGTPTGDPASVAPILRSDQPPVSQLDYDDRHVTRSTANDGMRRRYAELRKEDQKSDWHHLAVGLVGLVMVMAVYLAGFVIVSLLLPHLAPWEAMQVVGLAFLAAVGGVGASAGSKALTRRSRSRSPKSG